MITFKARDFFALSTFLKTVEHIVESPAEGTDVIAEKSKVALCSSIDQMITICSEIGLELSVMQLHRLRAEVNKPKAKFQPLAEPLRQLEDRIRDELQLNLFMAIPRGNAEYYDKPSLFGQAVSDSFTEATYDISEAGSCYASGRNTACVMHLMRALEVALDAIGLGVGISGTVIDAQNSWERLLDRIRRQIETNDRSGDLTWSSKRQFFVDAQAHLYAVKNAWRNPSMHLEKKYDDKEALRIYNAVKDFMEHLATHLDASGQFTP